MININRNNQTVMSKPQSNHPASRIASTLHKILKFSGGNSIDNQIEFIELLNTELMSTPIFYSIIQSLKELKAIKLNRNLNN